MADIVMGGTAEAEREPQDSSSSSLYSASPPNRSTPGAVADIFRAKPKSAYRFGNDDFPYVQKVQQYLANLSDQDRVGFKQKVRKLELDLIDEFGVDLLLLSGSEDDMEVLAVKVIWIERRRFADLGELGEMTKKLDIRK